MADKHLFVSSLAILVICLSGADMSGQSPPGAPSNLQVTVNSFQVVLTWNPPSDALSITSYVIEAGSAPGASDLAQLDTGGRGTTLTVGAPPGVYFVRVRARLGALSGSPSNEVIVTVPGGCALAAPAGLNNTVAGSTVTLTWQAVAGATRYVIEAGATAGLSNLAVIDTGSAATSLIATASPGTYYVRVRARNACSTGAPSNETTVIVSGAPLPPSSWLALVNVWRARAGVAPVVEEPTWSVGAALHSRYAVKTNASPYQAENPRSVWYSPEGDAVALNSIASWSSNVNDAGDESAIDSFVNLDWGETISLFDYALRRVGFGSYTEADTAGGIATAAVLDVKRGRDGDPTRQFPAVFPAPGATLPVFNPDWCPPGTSCSNHAYPGELTACGFYEYDMGPPLILQFGAGTTPVVTAASLTADGAPIQVCSFTGATYRHQSFTLQDFRRNLLNQVGGVVMFPRQPLPAGRTYTATATVNGQMYQWSFRVQ